MAIVVGKNVGSTHSFVIGDRLMVSVDVKGDSSYPTGGTAITPSTFQMSEIHAVHPSVSMDGSTAMTWDETNSKLKCFSALGTEVTNTTDLSGKNFRLLLIGRGYPKMLP